MMQPKKTKFRRAHKGRIVLKDAECACLVPTHGTDAPTLRLEGLTVAGT